MDGIAWRYAHMDDDGASEWYTSVAVVGIFLIIEEPNGGVEFRQYKVHEGAMQSAVAHAWKVEGHGYRLETAPRRLRIDPETERPDSALIRKILEEGQLV